MFTHRLHEKANFKTYFGWFLLSFLAGNINTGGFLSAKKFVSHITGFATLFGVSAAETRWWEALGFLTIPIFFLLGVMLSAYLTETQSTMSVTGQKFAPVMWLVAVIMGVVTVGGHLGWFGEFSSYGTLGHDYILLALLCGACGLQNAAITSASGSTVRTTHLTGITTDLGLGLIRAEVRRDISSEQRKQERTLNLIRLLTILSFALGSAVGAVIYQRFNYNGFIFPMILSLYAAWGAKNS